MAAAMVGHLLGLAITFQSSNLVYLRSVGSDERGAGKLSCLYHRESETHRHVLPHFSRV